EDIIDCGRLAASAINLQPWKFVVVTHEAINKQIADITDHGKFIAEAPVCVCIFCEDIKYYLEDGSAATQNILNAARAYGLGACWVAGDKKEYAPKICALLGLPSQYRLVSLIAIGEPAESRSPAKKPLAEVLSWEKYSG
ncbi:MAG: nitroreductase family protein, partial [Armatimonadota bacterium]|nr:nitroreductase family protein [Armatimonadota bacterium]